MNNQELPIFDQVDKTVLTLFNEPSMGLYYTQMHFTKMFPKLLFNMDSLHDNRKNISNTIMDINNTIRDLNEITSLNKNFSFKILAKINALNYEIKNKNNN